MNSVLFTVHFPAETFSNAVAKSNVAVVDPLAKSLALTVTACPAGFLTVTVTPLRSAVVTGNVTVTVVLVIALIKPVISTNSL